jgi:hypothetical protein
MSYILNTGGNMENDTTKRFPRTMEEAFNCNSDPISGPYGKEPVWPMYAIFFIVIVGGIILFWSKA